MLKSRTAAFLISIFSTAIPISFGVILLHRLFYRAESRSLFREILWFFGIFLLVSIILYIQKKPGSQHPTPPADAISDDSRLQLLSENITDVIAVHDGNSKLQYITASCEQVMGYTPDELYQQCFHDLIPPESKQILKETDARIKNNPGEFINYQYQMRHKQGHIIWLDETLKAVIDSRTGEIQSLVTLTRDITARKQIENQLRDSEARYRLLAENISDIVTLMNPDGTITYVSSSVEQILSYTPDELQEMNVAAYLHPESLNDMQVYLPQFASNPDESGIFTHRLKHKDGHWLWCETVIQGILDDGKKPKQIIGVTRDVTERKLAEEKERNNYFHLRLLSERATDLLVIYNIDGLFDYVSPSVQAILGYQPEELENTPAVELLHEEDLKIWKAAYLEDFGNPDRPPQRQQLRFRHKNGHYIRFESHSYNLSDNDNQGVIRVAAILRDMTGRYRMEQELRQNEAQLRFIIDQVDDVVFMLDADGHYQYFSPSCERVLGYRPDELIGRSSASFIPPDDLPDIEQHYLSITKLREMSFSFQHRFLHKSGEYIWLETHSTNTYNAEGEVISIVSISREITAQKLEIDELAEREALFRLLAEYTSDLIGRLDPDGTVTYISPQIKDILGYEASEIKGTRLFDKLHPDDVEQAWTNFQRIVDEPFQQLPLTEYRLQHRDGHYIWLEGTGRAVIDAETGKARYVVGLNRDITERKAQRDALIESEARFRLLAEYANDMIALHDKEGNFIYVSPSCRLLLGYEQDELIGLNYKALIHPEDLASFSSNIYFKTLDDSTIITKEDYRYKHKDGYFVWIETTARLAIKHTLMGESVRVSISRSIDKRKLAQIQLKENLKRERELNQQKLRFIEVITHEFRTPLTVILSSGELLDEHLEKLSPEQMRKHIQKIIHQTIYTREIMDGVLLIAQSEVKRLKAAWERVEIVSVAQGCFDQVYSRRIGGQQANFESHWDKLTIYSDERLLEQVIINLLDNAFKYTPAAGSILFRLDEEDAHLVITVSDTGIGIPEDEQARLFEPFTRGSNNSDISSVGIGLSIVQRSVDAMDGYVKVDSKLGAGTTFRVYLPLAMPNSSMPH